MTRVFFSVDVETSDLNPWEGELLTIGVEALDSAGNNLGELYVRIEPELHEWWYHPDLYPSYVPSGTAQWWMDQGETVRNEAWADETLVRQDRHSAALILTEFVVGLAPEWEDRVFVANPVAFDKMWVDSLYGQAELPNPFHYRSLCLRSMKFGLRPGSEWGSDRENHEPKIPHHALWDAKAQADDLRAMLAERDGAL